jgi:hypothetical protein
LAALQAGPSVGEIHFKTEDGNQEQRRADLNRAGNLIDSRVGTGTGEWLCSGANWSRPLPCWHPYGHRIFGRVHVRRTRYRRQISVLHIQVNFPLLLRAPAGRAGSGGCSDLHFHKRRPFGFPQPLLPRIELPIPQTAPRKRPPRSERSNSVRRPIHGTSSTLPSCPVSSHNCAPSSSIGQDVVRIALTKFPWRPSLNLQGLSPIADKPKGVYVPFYERVDAGVSRSCQNEFSLRYNFQSKDSATSWKCESRNGP